MKIVVNGALGRMGTQVVQQVLQEKDMKLVGVVDIVEGQTGGLTVSNNLVQTIRQTAPDVVVDFTKPAVVMDTLRRILPTKVRVVVGTTGFSEQDLAEVDRLARENGTAVMIAPNFALGAVVMIKLAAEAAKYFPYVEIIEKHHDKKLDAPSGTAVMTAKKIAQVRAEMRQGHPDEKETMVGCRGADYEGMKIHSLRLPGYVASQEVIFGGQGETLHISTEPINRECYMPGVMLACRKIMERIGLVYGLENVL